MHLHPCVALVTGGGRALGKSIALRLAADGLEVVVAGPEPGELEATAGEVEALGRRALAVVTDVTQEDQVAALVEQVRTTFGRLDVLANNAGIIGPTAPLAKIARAEWEQVLAVNLTGAFLCCRAALPIMMAQRCGRIINISSVAGKQAYPLRSPYAVSKWGLIGLTLTLAKEVGEYNILVNAVCPGPVQGERMQRVIAERAAELGQTPAEVEAAYVQAAALKRMVQAEDVAALVAFLASPAASNITGQAIEVSAGYGL
jgi:NAD(P)-dependent dehydrogenase (short-subunit alcohol dehydrogenase family)